MIMVDEIMTPAEDLATLGPDATLADAHRVMAERSVRHVPVVDSGGGLVGIVSDRDVLAATVMRPGGDPRPEDKQVPVSEIMATRLQTVDERANLRQAAIHMQALRIGCLPVVTDGVLRGIITDSDFVTVAIHLLEQIESTDPPEYE